MRFEVLFSGRVILGLSADPDLESHLDAVMEELVRLGADDPALAANGAEGTVEISVAVHALDLVAAMTEGSGVIRSAVHAAGGHTPGWSISWVEARATDTTQLVDA